MSVISDKEEEAAISPPPYSYSLTLMISADRYAVLPWNLPGAQWRIARNVNWGFPLPPFSFPFPFPFRSFLFFLFLKSRIPTPLRFRPKSIFLLCSFKIWDLMATVLTRKAVVARRYLRQGKAIRQVASPSSLCQRFPYAPFNAVVTKISKWSRIQDSCRITPKIESLVGYAMPDIPSNFQKDPFETFWVILYTHRQTNKLSPAKTLPPWRR